MEGIEGVGAGIAPTPDQPVQEQRMDGEDEERERPVPARPLRVVTAAEIRAEKLRWLFEGWILAGAVNVIAGREGIGKSTVALDFAARVTNGVCGEPRSVIFLGVEDDLASVVKPRLMAAGADLDRVLFPSVEKTGAPLQSAIDLVGLRGLIEERGVALMVLDPATVLAGGRLDGNDEMRVRGYLEPLIRLAQDTGCAILGIRHFGKRESNDTGKLMLGSIAFSTVPRSVIAVAVHGETERLVLTNTKANNVKGKLSLSAEIVAAVIETDDGPMEVGRVRWHGGTDLDARDLLAGDEDSEERAEAKDWLWDYLKKAGAPVLRQEVVTQAHKVKINETALKRAAKAIHVVSDTQGFPRVAYWSLPQSGHPKASVPRAGGGPTGPTGAEQGKHALPSWVNDPTGDPTAQTTSEQGEQVEFEALEAQSVQSGHEHGGTTTQDSGTGFVACAVCGKPVEGNTVTHVKCALKKANGNTGQDHSGDEDHDYCAVCNKELVRRIDRRLGLCQWHQPITAERREAFNKRASRANSRRTG
ncbi:AAA family ATPase [Segniliparus rotundus]|nr:AAA family ATPase [Segniliparus rotundus]